MASVKGSSSGLVLAGSSNPVAKIFAKWQLTEIDAEEYTRRMEELSSLDKQLTHYADAVRSHLECDLVLIADHNFEAAEGAGLPRFLAEARAEGVPSRAASPDHRIDRFAALLSLPTSVEGLELIRKFDAGRYTNSLVIEDLSEWLATGSPALAGFEWPWPDRSLCFTALVVEGVFGGGALSCVHSEPRRWSQQEGELLKEFAELASIAVTNLRVLERAIVAFEAERKSRVDFEDNLKGYFNKNTQLASFTPKERDVLFQLSSYGLSNKEIAAKLRSTERAVADHITNMLPKVAVSNRTQLAFFGQRLLNANVVM